MTQTQAVKAFLVADGNRLSILPRFLGTRYMTKGESLVYHWMGELSQDYTGGFWNYYTLSNGGFYMAPATDRSFKVSCAGNYFEGELSADAAGIVAVLFALGHLAGETSQDLFIDLYYQLRSYASTHAEANKIFAAID